MTHTPRLLVQGNHELSGGPETRTHGLPSQASSAQDGLLACRVLCGRSCSGAVPSIPAKPDSFDAVPLQLRRLRRLQQHVASGKSRRQSIFLLPFSKYLYMVRLFTEPAFDPLSSCQACQACLALQPTLLAAASCWTRGTSEGLHIPYSGRLRPLPRRTVPELRSVCRCALQHTNCDLPGATDATESTSCRPQRPVAPCCAPWPQRRCPHGQASAAVERPGHDEDGAQRRRPGRK